MPVEQASRKIQSGNERRSTRSGEKWSSPRMTGGMSWFPRAKERTCQNHKNKAENFPLNLLSCLVPGCFEPSATPQSCDHSHTDNSREKGFFRN
jgi:hypothetical protein